MSRRDDLVPLRHMLDHAREAIETARGRSRADLDSDRMLMHTSVRLVEVIGEAARRVSAQARAAHPEIPWDDIIGTRDRLIHGYDQVDLDILWDILELNLPPLVEQLLGILPDAKSG